MAFEAFLAAMIIFALGGVVGYYTGLFLNSDGYEDIPEEPEER